MKAPIRYVNMLKRDLDSLWLAMPKEMKDNVMIQYKKKGELPVIWSLFWMCRDTKPTSYGKYDAQLKDAHIETAIRKAIRSSLFYSKGGILK